MSPPPVPVLSQINPVHAPHSTSWRSILVLSFHLCLGLPSGPFPSGFFHQNPACISALLHTCYMPRSSHYSRFDHRIIFGEEYGLVSSSLCSFLHSPVTLSLIVPNILFSTLFSNTRSLHSSLNVSDQVSHPYKTTDKIIVLYLHKVRMSTLCTCAEQGGKHSWTEL